MSKDMPARLPALFLVLLLGALAAACATQPAVPPTTPAPAPTATPVPPMATPLPAADRPAPPADTPVLPTDTPIPSTPTAEPQLTLDGESLLQERCTGCHSLGRVEQARKTAADWQKTVERMVAKGAVLNAEEQAAVIKYLAETYAR